MNGVRVTGQTWVDPDAGNQTAAVNRVPSGFGSSILSPPTHGPLAQLVARLPCKEEVESSNLSRSTTPPNQRPPSWSCGSAWLRALACHARDRGFKSRQDRHPFFPPRPNWIGRVVSAHEVASSNLAGGSNATRAVSSVGRTLPCQGRGRGFEPRTALHARLVQRNGRPALDRETAGSTPPAGTTHHSTKCSLQRRTLRARDVFSNHDWFLPLPRE